MQDGGNRGIIVGSERDGRSFVLSDKLLPAKDRGKYVPTPIVHYYLGLAQYLGSQHRDVKMELYVTPSEQDETRALLRRNGLDENIYRPASFGHGPLVVLNPGAQYGAAKCWLPEYFAQVGDRLIKGMGATVLISSAPRERLIVAAVQGSMKHKAIDLAETGMSLGALKEIVRRCDLMSH